MAAKFVPLHVHSHYSLLKALPKIPDLVARAAEVGCEALALTDIDNMYGAIEFYKECKKAGIKPILGLDAHIGEGKRILLYAQNILGYQNLLAIVTRSHLDFPDNPTVTEEILEAHKDGIITLNPKTSEVALHEVYYLRPEDRRAWETLRAIENKDANEGGDIDKEDVDYSFFSEGQMEEKFANDPDALARTLTFATDCNLELTLGSWVFPDFPIPEGSSYNEELKNLVEAGLKKHLEDTPRYASASSTSLQSSLTKGMRHISL
jgi:DNA polymerase-3 subunit alpha